MTSRPTRFGLKFVAAVALVFLCLVAFRVSRDSQRALVEGDELAEARDFRGAIDAWRRAASMHLPLLPSPVAAIERLMDQGALSEAEGRPAEALMAYRAVHAAALEARSFYVPYGRSRGEADGAIARLESGDGENEARTRALSTPSAPSPFFFLANLSFVAAVVLAFVFIRTVNRVESDDTQSATTARRTLAAIALFVLLTLVGLWQA